MADLDTLRQRLDKLKEAHAYGFKSVTTGEFETVFRDPSELRKAIADLEAEIAAAEGRPAARIVNIRNSRGW